jgi:hypothetical protein
MAGRQRTTFAKLQRERARQEKQAAKRARRQGLEPGPEEGGRTSDEYDPHGFGPNGEVPAWLEEATAESAAKSEVSDSADPAAPGEPETAGATVPSGPEGD